MMRAFFYFRPLGRIFPKQASINGLFFFVSVDLCSIGYFNWEEHVLLEGALVGRFSRFIGPRALVAFGGTRSDRNGVWNGVLRWISGRSGPFTRRGQRSRSLPPGERAGIEEPTSPPTSPPTSSREGLGEMLRMEVQGSAGEIRREKYSFSN